MADRDHLDLRISRRSALSWLGGLGLAAFLPACADEESSAGPTTSTSTSSAAGTATQAGASCGSRRS